MKRSHVIGALIFIYSVLIANIWAQTGPLGPYVAGYRMQLDSLYSGGYHIIDTTIGSSLDIGPYPLNTIPMIPAPITNGFWIKFLREVIWTPHDWR